MRVEKALGFSSEKPEESSALSYSSSTCAEARRDGLRGGCDAATVRRVREQQQDLLGQSGIHLDVLGRLASLALPVALAALVRLGRRGGRELRQRLHERVARVDLEDLDRRHERGDRRE